MNATYKGYEGPLQGELKTLFPLLRHKQMEKHSIFMGRKKQYCEYVHTVQSNLQIECYPHQATTDFLHRIGKKHLKFHTEPKKSPYSQENTGTKTDI